MSTSQNKDKTGLLISTENVISPIPNGIGFGDGLPALFMRHPRLYYRG